MSIKVTATRTGTISSKIQIRDHVVPVDRPVSAAGTDTGPMGGELFVAALAGCYTSNLLAIAGNRDLELVDLLVEVEGEITDGRFTSAVVTVNAGVYDENELTSLAADAEGQCLVANTIRPAVALTFVGVPSKIPG